ncbi:RING finger protein 32-like [Lethenteron reissneri]|uniref:RING finger protein 32-like n=1 Tax=Lethenteron reissneri TaxID=7753 RepID=UPI002AB789CB|nr:RING finger protein 32-like [Lethenteron reissneri]
MAALRTSQRGGDSNPATVKELSSAIVAMAMQDHIARDLGLTQALTRPRMPRGPRLRQRGQGGPEGGPSRESGGGPGGGPSGRPDEEREYVLGPRAPPLTLAQRLCLVPAPQGAALSQEEWRSVKSRSAQRDLFSLPCVICRDELGAHTQVLLSCSHVFHQGCVEALERVARCRRCPVCRVSPYEARVVHEASHLYRHKCATRLQAWWRGVSARARFRRLRESVPPRDPALRRRFYENKLLVLGERLVRACDSGVDAFLREMEVERERRAQQSEGASASWDWERIEATALARDPRLCPICLTSLWTPAQEAPASARPLRQHGGVGATKGRGRGSAAPQRGGAAVTERREQKPGTRRGAARAAAAPIPACPPACPPARPPALTPAGTPPVLLSCAHVYHDACLEALEGFSVGVLRLCPLCRAPYSKRLLRDPREGRQGGLLPRDPPPLDDAVTTLIPHQIMQSVAE